MKVFADTFFFLALLDSRDAAHDEARQLARRPWRRIYTTDYILLELGSALSAPEDRSDFLALLAMMQRAPVYEKSSPPPLLCWTPGCIFSPSARTSTGL